LSSSFLLSLPLPLSAALSAFDEAAPVALLLLSVALPALSAALPLALEEPVVAPVEAPLPVVVVVAPVAPVPEVPVVVVLVEAPVDGVLVAAGLLPALLLVPAAAVAVRMP
jgi:hypothetical protein